MSSLHLIRTHNHTVKALNVTLPGQLADDRNGNSPLSKAGVFLLEAMQPIEQTAARHLQRLDGVVREGATKLTATKRQMRREVARHWICKRQLAQGTQHYGQLLAQSRRMQDQSRRLAHQILSAQEEERKEISRELHDEVAQILAGINVKLASLNEASAINGRGLRKRIAQTQRLVEQSVRVVHRYARELRPSLLDDLGLIPALRSYIKDLPGRNGLLIKFTAFAGVEELSNTRRTVLYRVAQEALTNVARHAHARLATVRIRKIHDAVCLEVHDNGRSFRVERILSSNTSTRLGLLGMRERVEMVGGAFAIESAPGKGTTVRAEIPFHGNLRGERS